MGAGLARERVASATRRDTRDVVCAAVKKSLWDPAGSFAPFRGQGPLLHNLAEGQIQPGVLYPPAAGQGVLEVGLHLR